jgi:hypothetical protein
MTENHHRPTNRVIEQWFFVQHEYVGLQTAPVNPYEILFGIKID